DLARVVEGPAAVPLFGQGDAEGLVEVPHPVHLRRLQDQQLQRNACHQPPPCGEPVAVNRAEAARTRPSQRRQATDNVKTTEPGAVWQGCGTPAWCGDNHPNMPVPEVRPMKTPPYKPLPPSEGVGFCSTVSLRCPAPRLPPRGQERLLQLPLHRGQLQAA